MTPMEQSFHLEGIYLLLVLIPLILSVGNVQLAFWLRRQSAPARWRRAVQAASLWFGTCVLWAATAAPFVTAIGMGQADRIATMRDIPPDQNIWFVDRLLGATFGNVPFLVVLGLLDAVILLSARPRSRPRA